jgi:transcriptional regulator with XRE-family HTH domain
MHQVTLGKMIRSARDEKGFSQTELGDRVEVPIAALRQARDASLLACQDWADTPNDLMINNVNLTV